MNGDSSLSGPKICPSPGKGHGLFSEKFYKKGDLITRYGGVHYNSRNPPPPSVPSEYLLYAGKGRYIDGSQGYQPYQKGRWCNEGPYTNAKAIMKEPVPGKWSVWIQAITSIPPNQEIYIDYGPEYDRSSYSK